MPGLFLAGLLVSGVSSVVVGQFESTGQSLANVGSLGYEPKGRDEKLLITSSLPTNHPERHKAICSVLAECSCCSRRQASRPNRSSNTGFCHFHKDKLTYITYRYIYM